MICKGQGRFMNEILGVFGVGSSYFCKCLTSCFSWHVRPVFLGGVGSDPSVSRKADVLFRSWAIRGGSVTPIAIVHAAILRATRHPAAAAHRSGPRSPEPPLVFKQSRGRGVRAARPGGREGRPNGEVSQNNRDQLHDPLQTNTSVQKKLNNKGGAHSKKE